MGCTFVRVDGLCSALGLEPAFRQGLGWGAGFKVQAKVNQNKSTRYTLRYRVCGLRRACVRSCLVAAPTAPTPSPHTPALPPRPLPDHTIGGGRERQTPDHMYTFSISIAISPSMSLSMSLPT